MKRRLQILLILRARHERISRTYTARGLREVWCRYKRTSITPRNDFASFTRTYWELRDGCH